MTISAFDIFKVGIGPSSSHTVGPMRAARLFGLRLRELGLLERCARVEVQLFGSLGSTGRGHGTDKAVLLGLLGHEPESVDVDAIAALLEGIRSQGRLGLLGAREVAFDERRDLVFHRRKTLPFHANAMQCAAFDADGVELDRREYYSVGGGFVVGQEAAEGGGHKPVLVKDVPALPYPFSSGAQLLELTQAYDCSIAQIMRRNERHWRSDEEINAGLLRIWRVMQDCVKRGCATEG
ncbi:serine dehydratase beta chain, partial [Azohydromonas lata]|uniref:serine dehydratase beta chain n=1 Tax=Azohydromonas lata TaxID=45677 RepID=UPI00157D86ED